MHHTEPTAAPVLHLAEICWKSRQPPSGAGFPFDVPAIRALTTLELRAPVTFFVGENGTGKSTLLEVIALAANLPTVGARDLPRDPTLAAQRRLAASLRLRWAHRTSRGFFLRAEDFFGYVQRLAAERSELEQRLAELEDEYRRQDRSQLGLTLAQGPVRASLGEMTSRYGVELDSNSHGQSFLQLFQARVVPGGLYLLDEPEAALSPQSQLGLLAMLLDSTAGGSQFLIATHAPILLGFEGADILSFDELPPTRVPYESLSHVTLTRDFLNDRTRYLRELRRAVEGDGQA
jgi:predicted ATPase